MSGEVDGDVEVSGLGGKAVGGGEMGDQGNVMGCLAAPAVDHEGEALDRGIAGGDGDVGEIGEMSGGRYGAMDCHGWN